MHDQRGQQLLEKGTADADNVKEINASREARLTILCDQLVRRTCHAWDLYPKKALQRLAKDGIYSWDDPFAVLGAGPLDYAQRIAVFKNIISHLEMYYPWHTIGLVEEGDQAHLIPQWPTFWLVKKGHTVVLQSRYVDEKGKWKVVDIEIQDTRLADSFYQYFFEEIWGMLPIESEKDQVIKWLQQRIAYIRGRQRRILKAT